MQARRAPPLLALRALSSLARSLSCSLDSWVNSISFLRLRFAALKVERLAAACFFFALVAAGFATATLFGGITQKACGALCCCCCKTGWIVAETAAERLVCT